MLYDHYVPLEGSCSCGISFHTGECCSASPCGFSCASPLSCSLPTCLIPRPNSGCLLDDDELVVFTCLASSAITSSDEVTSVMESPEEDSRVAVGTFTGLGVGLLGQIGGVCCCSKNKRCTSLSVLLPASARWTKTFLSFYTYN